MSLVMGALGGAGKAAGEFADSNIKLLGEEEIMRQRADLDTQKQQFLQDAKLASEKKYSDLARTEQTQRIDEAAKPFVQQAIDTKYAGAQPADPSTWTPEQQAAVDESKQLDQQAFLRDPNVRTKAAMTTGDIAPKDVLAASTKEEIANITATARQAVQEAKNESWREKIEYLTKKASEDNNTRLLIAAMKGGGKDGSDTAKIKTAQVYLDTVNAERSKGGQEPITFEEAFSIANYAPKASQEDSVRARVATTLINNDPKLLKDPVALQKAVTATLDAIKGDGSAPAPKPIPTPKPGAAPSPTRPPLGSFWKD
jgi:hypothetical protein